MCEINPKNIAKGDIVKLFNKDDRFLLALPVTAVTKTQIHVTLDADFMPVMARFRRSDGKEITSNGKLVEEGFTLNLRDILRFT